MPDEVAKKANHLRQINFRSWVTTLWLVKRRLVEKEATYSVLRVDTDTKLQAKLKKAVTDKVQSKKYKLEEYSFLSADQDDRVFTIATSDTDFSNIQTEIEQGLNNKKAEKYDDLLDSWAYVVKVEQDRNPALYGLRKINKLTQAKKVGSLASFLFRNQLLIDLDDEHVFTIDTRIDFFAYDGTTFITNKKEFESALNFRKGMEANRDTVLGEFKSLKIVGDVEPLRKIIGSNLHRLRKISAIHKSGYYKDKTFMRNLIRLNKEEGWGLLIEKNHIVVTEENVDLVLTLLNNSRLKSPINQEVFDASVKKKVE